MFMFKKFFWLQKLVTLVAVFFTDVSGVSIKPSVSNSDLKVGDSVEITAAVTYQGSQFISFKFLNGITPIAELKSSSTSNFSITTEGKELFGDRVSVKSNAFTFTMSILNLTVADSMTITMEFSSKKPLVTVTEKIKIVVTDYDAKSLTTQLLLLYNTTVCNGTQKPNTCLLPEAKIRKANEIVNSSLLITTPEDILLLSKIIDDVVFKSSHAKEISDGVFSLVDKILEVNTTLLSGAQGESNSSRKFLSTLDSFAILMAEDLEEYKKTKYNISKSNIALSVDIVKREDVYITAYEDAEKENKVAISNQLPETYFEELASIFIPGSVLDNINNSIYSFFYLKPHFFTTNEKLFIKDSEQSPNGTKIGVAVSPILSASIINQTIENLTNPISIKFKKINPNKLEGRFDCYFWSIRFDVWSKIGCHKQKEDDTEVLCECDHLTNFALIMDVSQSHSNPKELQWLSQIGCLISLVGLTLSLITLILFKELRQKLSMKILICLCTSLFVLLVIFLVGAKRGSSSQYSCRIVAGMLHYFVLTTFCWTAVQGANLYRYTVTETKSITGDTVKFMVASSIFAWGSPLVVVLITAGAANSSYIGRKFCIIRGNYFYFGLLTPVAVILFMNISILVMVMNRLNNRIARQPVSSPENGDFKRILHSCRTAFTCSILLGLTWVFGMFTFGGMEYTFQILFVIFNSLQGFFLFVLNIPLNPNVRKKWLDLMADIWSRRNKKKRLDKGLINNRFVLESSKSTINTSCTDVT